VAILDNSLWRSRFGSDPGILGRTLQLDDEAFQIIGVLAADVRIPSTIRSLLESGLDGGDRALWVPIRFDMVPPRDRHTGSQDLEAVGRLVPGATVDQLRSELDVFVREERSKEILGFRLTPMKEEIVGGHRASLNLLLAASGLLLLIACINTAALLMSEAVGRRHEMATRVALGAGRSRIVRQLLTESVILGLLGSALGLALSFGGLRGFLAFAPSLPRLEEVGVNHAVLLFAVLAGVGTGVLFGLVPALTLRKESIHAVQTGNGRRTTKGGGRFQQGLLAVELAMTLVLLVSGGLLTRSLLKLSAVDPGFDGRSVATVRVYLPHSEGSGPDREFFSQMLARVREIPGVEEAGGIDGLPFPGRVSGSGIRIHTGGEEPVFLLSRNHVVTPGYFETVRAQILAGRSFRDSDAAEGGLGPMVINDLLAKRYWPGASPLGSRVDLNGRGYEVVGVVEDVLERHLAEDPKPMVYVVGPELSGGMSVVARGSVDDRGLAAEMRRAIWALDPDLPVTQESTLPALVKSSTSGERYRTALVLVFGILATLLASIGVFGITAHTVSKRSREMGIRMAMGAEGTHLVRTVVSQTLVPGFVGVVLGLMGAMAASRLLSSYLFGVEAWDLPTYGSVSLLLAVLAAVAAAIPAARAARVDPVQVLKEE
jgi:predicted permease